MSPHRARRSVAALAAAGLLAAARLLPADRPLPIDVCPLHMLTGLPCLTCGLTRSVCLFSRWDWDASLQMHPAGWLAFGVLAVTCLWLAGEAAAGRSLAAHARARLLRLALGFGGVLSVAAWSARLVRLFPVL